MNHAAHDADKDSVCHSSSRRGRYSSGIESNFSRCPYVMTPAGGLISTTIYVELHRSQEREAVRELLTAPHPAQTLSGVDLLHPTVGWFSQLNCLST